MKYLTFSEVARQLDVHASTVSKWGSQGVRVRGRERVRLANVLLGARRVTTSELLNEFLNRIREARFAGMSDPVAERAEELLRQQISEERPT